jgi:aldose 1-epimerase
MSISIEERDFGRLPDGTAVSLYTLSSDTGLSVSVSSYGAIVTSVRVPDRNGSIDEVTLAYDSLEEYLSGHPYYGSFVGRVCNRISDGGFEIDETHHEITNNAGAVHLHGGTRGFNAYSYSVETTQTDDRGEVRFTRTSPAGEEGYPGALTVTHTISIDDAMRLRFSFEAETDAPTIVNLTNHCYWNLSSEATILDHEIRIPATTIAEMEGSLPTGKYVAVEDTPFDFREIQRIGDEITRLDADGVGGYDHSFAIPGWEKGPIALREAAEVRAPHSGRRMLVRTTYPAVHFYSGNFLPGQKGRDGSTLSGREALCLECQYFPNAPHRPEFPSIELRPGEWYYHITEHEFGTY